MATQRTSKTLETLKGIGAVYREDKWIASVNYSITITQEIIISRSVSGSQELPGVQEITGVLAVLEGESNLTDGTPMILHLVDGRQWEFFATRGNPVSGEYLAVNRNPQGITKQSA